MRIVFMGTPAFAATILEDLLQQHEVAAVYTRPDAVRGRGKKLQPSPVKQVALRFGLPVIATTSLRDEAVRRKLASFEPDVICVAAFGAILPEDVLALPPYGCLNVHASLLPRWRGAAPIERAILAGDDQTGVCVMRMEKGLDTGPYCVCRTARIEGKSATELSDELASLGSNALLTALVHVTCNADDWTDQDESAATYAPKIEKGELNLAPSESALVLARKVQASSDAHPARGIIAKRGVTVLAARDVRGDAHAAQLTEGMEPGSVRFAEKRLFLSGADGALEVRSLKPDGKQEMAARAFADGVQGIQSGAMKWEALHV